MNKKLGLALALTMLFSALGMELCHQKRVLDERRVNDDRTNRAVGWVISKMDSNAVKLDSMNIKLDSLLHYGLLMACAALALR